VHTEGRSARAQLSCDLASTRRRDSIMQMEVVGSLLLVIDRTISLVKHLNKYLQVSRALEKELAERMATTPDSVQQLRAMSRDPVSLDLPVKKDGGAGLGDLGPLMMAHEVRHQNCRGAARAVAYRREGDPHALRSWL